MMTELVVDFLVRSTVILCTAWAATFLLRRASADIRHKIWLAALIGAMLAVVPFPVPEPFRIEVEASGVTATAAMVRSVPGQNIWLLVWAAGALLIAARLLVGLVLLARWKSQASDFHGCMLSRSVSTAITWGVVRPVILLPEYMRSWPAESREIVILHERAHIVRHDWVWRTFAQLATAMFWFQPFMWIASARLREEAERAADDYVLARGISPAVYATNLVEAGRRLRGSVPCVALGMAQEDTLPSRIRAVLDSDLERIPAGRKSRLSIIVASAGLLLVLAACQSARVYQVAEVTTPPRVVTKTEPQYTDEARTRKIAGKVVLKLVVDSKGRAENVRVAQSLDRGLDGNAIAAIHQWQFDPGRKDGKPVRTAATIEVNYHLR